MKKNRFKNECQKKIFIENYSEEKKACIDNVEGLYVFIRLLLTITNHLIITSKIPHYLFLFQYFQMQC